MVDASGAKRHVVIVGGSSSNARGMLGHYALQPAIIIQDGDIPEAALRAALRDDVESKILRLGRVPQ